MIYPIQFGAASIGATSSELQQRRMFTSTAPVFAGRKKASLPSKATVKQAVSTIAQKVFAKAPTPALPAAALVPQTVYSFGTSGYRNDTETGFNATVVRQITASIADTLITDIEKTGKMKPVLVGGDTRDKTRQYLPLVAKLLQERGLDVYVADGDVPSPVLAYAAAHFDRLQLGPTETAGAVLMTASHNPWPYGGYNFLTPDGAVAPTEITTQFLENQKQPQNKVLTPQMRKKLGLKPKAAIRKFDPYPAYQAHVKSQFGIDFAKIQNSGLAIFYDAMYATGRRYFPRLLKDEGIDITSLHNTDVRPAGYQGMPEPTDSQLDELREQVKASENPLKIGFANDGDADRFGVLDERGRFISANEGLALILYHLVKNRGEKGRVVRNHATSHLVDAVAKQAKLPVTQTPVGYKYIAELLIAGQEQNKPVILGGESSGGVTVKGHIPEKDGILANLLLAELVATEGKPLGQILRELKQRLPQKFDSRELIVTTEQKDAILESFAEESKRDKAWVGNIPLDVKKTRAAARTMQRNYGTKDGVKMYLTDGSWVLVRKSGTEPLLRVFVEAVGENTEEARQKANRLQRAMVGRLTGSRHHLLAKDIKVKH